MIFILSVLSVLVAVFLIMIAVQLIRIEKEIDMCTDIVELYVKKLYHRE
jgi:hypothetical protein